MRVEIASPAGHASFDDAQLVELRAPLGLMGILPGHADYLGEVAIGPFRIELPGQRIEGVLGSGVVRVESGTVILAVEQWADTAPAVENLSLELTALRERLADTDTDSPAAERMRRSLAYLETWAGRGSAAGA